ncbi:MAG: hypothetical protein WCB27_00015 [Thermoguttaceae bacterium]
MHYSKSTRNGDHGPPACDPAELRRIVAKLVALDQASAALLSDAVQEALVRIHNEVVDRQHCTCGQRLYIEAKGMEWAGLLDVPVDVCEQVVEDVVLRPRWHIIEEVLDAYLDDIDTGGRPEPLPNQFVERFAATVVHEPVVFGRICAAALQAVATEAVP